MSGNIFLHRLTNLLLEQAGYIGVKNIPREERLKDKKKNTPKLSTLPNIKGLISNDYYKYKL